MDTFPSPRPRRLALALALMLGASVGACTLPNPDHCLHRSADADAWCAEHEGERPWCSPCAAEHHGCVAEAPLDCPEYSPAPSSSESDSDSASESASPSESDTSASDTSTSDASASTAASSGNSPN